MKKIHQKTTDFFSVHRSSQLRKYGLSGGIAVFVAFSFVSLVNSGIDTQGLMASVANVSSGVGTQHYDADLIMTRENNTLIFTFGSTAQKVDRIDFTLLGDPARFHSVSSTDTGIEIVGQAEMGVYHVSVDMHGRDIKPGTRVADLISVGDTGSVLAISDTQFVSGGQRYSLSSKGE